MMRKREYLFDLSGGLRSAEDALLEVHEIRLPDSESARLSELEDVIERGLSTFVEVGQALLEIRDSRLYRATHPTFETYCREKWNMSRRHANRLVQAAEVVEVLGPIGPIPTTESHARELVPLLDNPDGLREIATNVFEIKPTATARDVREAVRKKMDVHYSSETDMWATPQDLFDELDTEFSFTLDVCATAENAKCERFFTVEDDGLSQKWTGSCWMNPPYGDAIKEWVRKAYESAQEGATVVCLVPARVDTGWWWDYCRYGQVRFLRGRLKFGDSENSAPFPSAVVVFGADYPADTLYWERASD